MYYAGGTVCWPSVRRGLREDGAIGVAEEGRRTREGRGSMCVTCVAAITRSRGWLPGNAFQPPHTHTTLDQPQNPLLSLPYFASWRTISFFWLSNTTSMPHCSTTSTLILIPATLIDHSLSWSWWSFSQRFFSFIFLLSFPYPGYFRQFCLFLVFLRLSKGDLLIVSFFFFFFFTLFERRYFNRFHYFLFFLCFVSVISLVITPFFSSFPWMMTFQFPANFFSFFWKFVDPIARRFKIHSFSGFNSLRARFTRWDIVW